MAGRTYRYHQGPVLYPFGYGLTYGDCRVTGAGWEPDGADGFRLWARVRNDGAETDEVLQVYVRPEDTPWATPNPALGAFRRIHLARGGQDRVELALPRRALTTVDEAGERRLRGRRFTLYLGFSQPDARSVALTGREPFALCLTLP